MIYGSRSNGNQHGLVLTKPFVVNVMLDRIGYIPKSNLKDTVIIEPAAGEGAYALPIIERLYKSSINFGFSFQEALTNVRFYEIDENIADLLKERVENRLNEYHAFLPEDLIQRKDFLLSNTGPCNIVVGNPPYVRHENIPAAQKLVYRKHFRTFTHRSDLYIAFYEKSLRILEENGILSFICSNRWLKNQYGKNLRELISLHYSLKEIIDLEGTCPFEEDVIAYPAITTIHKTNERLGENYYRIENIQDLLNIDRNIKPIKSLNTRHSNNWFVTSSNGGRHEMYLDSIENQGFKIGIGVATGSDKIFIKDDFKLIVENELLLPILMSKDLRNNELEWSGNYILNPFNSRGKLIDLEKYPMAGKYLNSHKEILLKRHVSKRNPEKWYRTIDRITPQLTQMDKIILPDISGNSHLFIDRGNFYPHHNLYYITGKSYDKLILLAAILMSKFVKSQLLELGNKMNGGYARWQSQNLQKLRVPIIDTIPEETAQILTESYHLRDYNMIDKLINPKEISNYCFSIGQICLFEPESERY